MDRETETKIFDAMEEAWREVFDDQRDAKRYRALRRTAYVGVNPYHRTTLWCLRGVYAKDGESFDAAVDALIK